MRARKDAVERRSGSEILRVLSVSIFFVACMTEPGDVGTATGALDLPFTIPNDLIVPTQPVGGLLGEPSVSLGGVASYGIPLEVPVGRAGMQPNLTLSYNSAAGNGLLGVGFSISGLTSTITRCVHPHEAGGARRIHFDGDDRFCLDGEPLVQVDNGVQYGEDGSEYRTERESVRRILAFGAGLGGPTTFLVEEASGRRATYQTAPAAPRVHYEELTGPEVPATETPVTLQWSVTRVEDRFGNAMIFGYEDDLDGEGPAQAYERRPSSIEYTEWTTEAARRSVRIVYQPRPDVREVFLGGTRARLDERIERIEMYAPNLEGVTKRVWYYEFTYLEPSETSITGRSLLESVRRCDDDGLCVPATTFDWSLGSFQYDEITIGAAGLYSTQLGDVDGDGRDDMIRRHDYPQANIYRGSSSGFAYIASTSSSLASAPLIADITGDGRAELIGAEADNQCDRDVDCPAGMHCVDISAEGGRGFCAFDCRCLTIQPPPVGGSCPPSDTDCARAEASCVSTGVAGEPGICSVTEEENPFEACGCAVSYSPLEDASPSAYCGPVSSCAGADSPICGDYDGSGNAECVSDEWLRGDGWRVHRYVTASTEMSVGQLLEGSADLGTHGAINLLDVDGDGDPDLIRRDAETLWSLGQNTGDESTVFQAVGNPLLPAELAFFDPRGASADTDEHAYGAVIDLGDLDGDGRTEVLIPVAGELPRYAAVTPAFAPASDETYETNLRAKARDQVLMDVNGDGLADAVDLRRDCGSSVCVDSPDEDPEPRPLGLRLNTGNGFTPRADASLAIQPFWPEEVTPPAYACPTEPTGTPLPLHCGENRVPWYTADLRVRALDYNQDGAQDLLLLGPRPSLYLSDGAGSFHAFDLPFGFDDTIDTVEPAPGATRFRRPVFLVGDVNADGQPDFVHGENPLVLHVSMGGRADQLLSVTNGLGAVDAFEYGSLSEPTVYDDRFDFGADSDPDGPGECGYPHACVNRRGQVIRALRRSNPGHPDRVTTYRYAGGRRDARTGEFLGFARVYTEDLSSGESTEIWTRPTFEATVEDMRGSYHPLAHRAVRVYSAVQVGAEAHVTRVDVRYGFPDHPATAFQHPLVQSGDISRGLRVLVSDLVVRQYRDVWTDWVSSAGDVSDRYGEMRSLRHVDAWRSDHRQYDFGSYPCIEADVCLPGAAGFAFPYPGAWSDATYDTDVGGPDSGELFPPTGGWLRLSAYDSDVQIQQRVQLDRAYDTRAWLIGLPRAVVVERCEDPDPTVLDRRVCPRAGHAPQVVRNRVDYTYDANLVHTVTREPFARAYDDAGERTGLTLTVTLLRDRGNITEVLQESPYGESRRATVQYDDLERIFPAAVTAYVNTLALTSWTGWHPGLGVPLVELAPSGARTDLRYDTLGRPRGVKQQGADWVNVDYATPSWGTGLSMLTSGPGVPDSVVTFDARLRTTDVSLEGYRTSNPIEASVGYDALGRVVSTSVLHYAGAPAATFETAYDTLGRATSFAFRPAPGATPAVLATYEHWLEPSPSSSGTRLMASSATDALGNRTERWVDLRGWLERSRERVEESGVFRWIELSSEHDLRGIDRSTQLESATVGAASVQEVLETDILGRPLKVRDPDRGETSLRYNSFGELVWQRNARGDETTFHYDELGRLDERDDDGALTTWVWDTAPNGEGLLAGSLSPDGHSVTYEYDSQGRLVHEHQSTGDIDYTYDAVTGLVEYVSYPRNAAGTRLTVQYRYEDGRLAEIFDKGADEVLWEAVERHPDGRLSVELTGGGATTERTFDDRTGRLRYVTVTSMLGANLTELETSFDEAGRMELRIDHAKGRTESFEHDALGRLTGWIHDMPAGSELTRYTYDDRGNLTQVENVESGPKDNLYYEGVRNAGPHGVTTFNTDQLWYDEVGRQVIGPGGRSIDYNHLDLPTRVVASGRELNLRYDADGGRVEASHFDAGDLVLRVEYVGRLYERRTHESGVQHVYYVYGPDGVVAQISTDDAGGDRTALFLHSDGLGTVTFATDENGELVENTIQRFSPFGRRLADDGTYSATPTTQLEVTRGFTGHEHDATFDLVNMQGRIYDSRLRRFTTPDPLVTMPSSSQSWNAYSYVVNSPLNLVDPTGFNFIRPEPPPEAPPLELSPAVERFLNDTSLRDTNLPAPPSSTLPGASGAGGGGMRDGGGGGWTNDAWSLAQAFGEGLVEGTEGLAEGLGRQILENPASPVTPFYRAASAWQNFEQGNIAEGLLDVVTIHPVLGAIRIGVETVRGVGGAVETTADTLRNGSAEDAAKVGGRLTPLVIAAIASRRLPALGGGGRGVRLQHGTTMQRARRLLRTPPDPDFIEPGGGPPAGGFSTAPPEGPHPLGTPRQYAVEKARLFPGEGGPAVLEIEVPRDIVQRAVRTVGEVRFEPGMGLEELVGVWDSLPKRFIY